MKDKKEAHTSSASDHIERNDVHYKKESEVPTFIATSSTVSSSDPYPPTTIKIARNVKSGTNYSPTFCLKISKIKREERNYSINQQIAGKRIETVSTKND